MNENSANPAAVPPGNEAPEWHRPQISILDVETGTLAVTGPHADGLEGSTS